MLVLLFVSMRNISTQGRAQVQREGKNALAFKLTTARFDDMLCFTSTYAYVRVCVASENKAFMLVPIPGLRF